MTQAQQDFLQAQQRMLERHGVDAEARFVEIPSIEGQAQVLSVGAGPTVLMINGIGTPAAMWAPLMAELDGLRLLAVDLPGYGLTDTTPRLTEDLRHRSVLFLTEVLDALQLDRVPFVANSMGSLWTLWLALDHPQRVSAMVHLGCPATILGTSAPLPMRLMSIPLLGRLLTRLEPPSPRQVEKLARMVEEHPMEPELADLLLATERLPGFRDTFLATLHVLLTPFGARDGLDVDQLARITTPVLLLWGRRDPFGSPEIARRVASNLPEAELYVMDGGHAPWLDEAPQLGSMAARFLHDHD